MKKLLLIALLLTSAAFTSKAQIKAGIKGGGSVSTLHYSDYKNIDSFLKADFYAGVHTSVKLFGNLHAQPELLYSKKGFEGKELESFKVDLEYITLPFLLKYEFYERVSVLGGIEVGALAKAIQKNENDEIDIRKSFKKADAGFVAGVSVNLTDWLGLEARYNSGFVPLKEIVYTDDDSFTVNKVKDGYNRNFQAGLYFNFIK